MIFFIYFFVNIFDDDASNLLENKKSTGEISDRNSIQKMHTKWENYVSISFFLSLMIFMHTTLVSRIVVAPQ